MKIFIDFDDVLFNTAKFRQVFEELFITAGLTNEQFQETYQQARKNEQGIDGYNFNKHIKLIGELDDVNGTELRKSINTFLESTKKYLFPDVMSFLEKYKDDGHELFLVSFGSDNFQMKKIEGSGIQKNFTEIKIGQIDKAAEIQVIIEEYNLDMKEPMIFIDDRIEQIEEVKTELPDIQTILLQRSEGRYKFEVNQYCDYQCQTLQEVIKTLNNLEVVKEIKMIIK
jgi:phosphoglycolate phosphatase-like HAD superfamily hydrolase